jgi:hypothetical protein
MLLDSPSYKLDMKKAAQLREFSEKKPLKPSDVEEILAGLAGKKRTHSAKPLGLKLKPKTLAQFFTAEYKPDEMEAEIVAALTFYRANKPKEPEKPEESQTIGETEDTEVDANGEEKDMGDEPE